MIRNLTEWDEDDKGNAEDEYEALRRSLSWTEGFGLLFVDCTPATAEKLMFIGTSKPTTRIISRPF